jgi:hypothetical protein
MAREAKLFGKYNDFALLVFGFALTGLLGAAIQERSWAYQHGLTNCEADRATSEKVFEDISALAPPSIPGIS